MHSPCGGGGGGGLCARVCGRVLMVAGVPLYCVALPCPRAVGAGPCGGRSTAQRTRGCALGHGEAHWRPHAVPNGAETRHCVRKDCCHLNGRGCRGVALCISLRLESQACAIWGGGGGLHSCLLVSLFVCLCRRRRVLLLCVRDRFVGHSLLVVRPACTLLAAEELVLSGRRPLLRATSSCRAGHPPRSVCAQ